MKFHTFGDVRNKTVVLIHGVLTPWQIWQKQIDYFSQKYYVIVPALDGHIEEEESEYISVKDEANKIAEYLQGQDIYAVCGLSMGGAIAYTLFESRRLNIENLILDGAPLVPVGKIPTRIMTNSYKSIIAKSKKRDPKVLENFKKDFLPEKYLDSFLKFADTMTDTTIENMITSVFSTKIQSSGNSNTKILFMHGTKGNEVVSQKAAKKLKEVYPQTVIKCFKGLKHAELAIYKEDEWINTVSIFIG